MRFWSEKSKIRLTYLLSIILPPRLRRSGKKSPIHIIGTLPDRLRSQVQRRLENHEPTTEDGDLSIKRASRRSEEDLIKRALLRTRGNRTRAAELLEISHRALLYKIKDYEITDL